MGESWSSMHGDDRIALVAAVWSLILPICDENISFNLDLTSGAHEIICVTD
jgi:hypothetical protein